MNLSSLTAVQLNRAADIKEKIETLNAELSALLDGSVAAPAAKAPKGKRTMSASARAKIAAAQKARWAKQKGAAVKSPVSAAPKPAKKRTMSAAGRARIIAAQKARWAKVKAAKKS